MPPLPDYPHVLKIRTLFLVGADLNVSTTVHFTYSGTAPTDAVCTTIAGDIYTAAVADLVSLIGDENQLHGVQVQDLTSPTSGFGEHIADTLGADFKGHFDSRELTEMLKSWMEVAEDILDRNTGVDDDIALKALKVIGEYLERYGKATGEIKPENQVVQQESIGQSAEWRELREAIFSALIPFPEAREAVLAQLGFGGVPQLPETTITVEAVIVDG